MSDERHDAAQTDPAGEPEENGVADGRWAPDDPTGDPGVGVLRATRAFLLPRPVREGLEMALGEVCEATRDEGMDQLEEHPAIALSRAILHDLEAALGVVDELEDLVAGGTAGREELGAYAAIASAHDLLEPMLRLFRERNEELRQRLRKLGDAVGGEP